MALAPLTLTWLWMVLLALGMGAFAMCLTLLGLRARTPETTVALSTSVQGCGYLITASGPLLVGVLRGATGGYTGMFVVISVALTALLISGWVATRPRSSRTRCPDVRARSASRTSSRWRHRVAGDRAPPGALRDRPPDAGGPGGPMSP